MIMINVFVDEHGEYLVNTYHKCINCFVIFRMEIYVHCIGDWMFVHKKVYNNILVLINRSAYLYYQYQINISKEWQTDDKKMKNFEKLMQNIDKYYDK